MTLDSDHQWPLKSPKEKADISTAWWNYTTLPMKHSCPNNKPLYLTTNIQEIQRGQRNIPNVKNASEQIKVRDSCGEWKKSVN